MTPEILRYAAFTTHPAGGNPAGVVLDAGLLDGPAMQAIATQVGYSETAFLAAADDPASPPDAPAVFSARYFSPVAEVPFCGHATIAAAVARADRDGAAPIVLQTAAGAVAVDVTPTPDGHAATLTSVEPRTEPVTGPDLDEALGALGWTRAELDPALPPRIADAGARHLVLAAATPERLAALDYDFDRLRDLMLRTDLTTLQLVHRAGEHVFRARDPFPVGGVVEDPATGAAAAALGGYLRELGLVRTPCEIVVHQGEEMGRPSLLRVAIPPSGGIRVTGTAVPLAAAVLPGPGSAPRGSRAA